MRRALFAAALTFCAGCATTRTAADVDPSEVEQMEEVVAERATPWLRVEAGNGVTRKMKLDVMKRIGRAFDYALESHGWNNPEALCEETLVVNVRKIPGAASDVEAKTGAELNVEFGAQGTTRLDRLLAHEVTHVQDLRVLKQASRTIPRYLYEGKALAVGNRYRIASGDRAAEAGRAKWIARFTADEALLTLRQFRAMNGSITDKQTLTQHVSVSAFFVEYLRTRVAGQRGDVIPMLARVFERVGAGEQFEAAFEEELGVPIAHAEEGFVGFIKTTEGKPTDRLRGTVYAGLADGR